MWKFHGKYTGEAKAYLKRREKKEYTIASILGAAFFLLFCGAIALADHAVALSMLIVGVSAAAVFCLAMFLLYRFVEPKVTAEVTNDGVNVYNFNGNFSLPFYRIAPIAYHDDFIVLAKKYVLQKDLLVEGEWEELVAQLKKIEQSLDTDDPVTQIEEPQANFISAKVVSKRIYEKFVPNGSVRVLAGVYHYFATFESLNGTTAEYEIGQDYYDRLEEGQTGTLVIMNGNFIDFGDGKDLE